MDNTKYTFELSAMGCDMSMMSHGGTRTMRLERNDDQEHLVLVLNTTDVTDDTKLKNELYKLTNVTVTINITGDPAN